MRAGWAVALWMAAWAGAQTAGGPMAAGPMRTYSAPGLQLTFSYPAELQIEESAAGATDTVGCSRTLLVAGMGVDPDLPGAKETAGSAHWARLTMAEAGCVTARLQKKTKLLDQMLAGMTGSAGETLGMMPMEQPVGYLIEGHHVYLSAAQGEPVENTVVQPANGAEVVAVIATTVKDRFVTWRLESNDPALLNRMLASRVDFGSGPPQALYPGHIGEE